MKLLPHAFHRHPPLPPDEVVVVELPSAHHPADLEAMQCAIGTPLARGATRLAVDVSPAEFVCTTAVGYLVHSIKQARDRGGDLRFFGRGTEADGSFRRLLALCGVQAMFLTYPSRNAAVASFVDGSGPGAEG